MRVNPWGLVTCVALAILSAGCQSESQREAERRRADQDRGSAAFKVGQAAHTIARKAETVAATAGRKLDESARKAHEGWKEQSRTDREKK
ncbi:MAG: hypothetical protein M3N54_02040 [Acidobacteriota bacterium]|nr:hypothetical protein [Acidobacteriota bacterium]